MYGVIFIIEEIAFNKECTLIGKNKLGQDAETTTVINEEGNNKIEPIREDLKMEESESTNITSKDLGLEDKIQENNENKGLGADRNTGNVTSNNMESNDQHILESTVNSDAHKPQNDHDILKENLAQNLGLMDNKTVSANNHNDNDSKNNTSAINTQIDIDPDNQNNNVTDLLDVGANETTSISQAQNDNQLKHQEEEISALTQDLSNTTLSNPSNTISSQAQPQQLLVQYDEEIVDTSQPLPTDFNATNEEIPFDPSSAVPNVSTKNRKNKDTSLAENRSTKAKQTDDGVLSLKEDTKSIDLSLNTKQYNLYGPFMGQVMGTMKDCCRKAFLNGEPRLYEAIYLCTFQVKIEHIGKIHSVINKRRGKVK